MLAGMDREASAATVMDLNNAGAGARDCARPEEVHSVLGIDLNEIPSPAPSLETLPSSLDPVAVVRTFHGSVTPADGAPAEKPCSSSYERCGSCGLAEVVGPVIICDGCERGFHVNCVGIVELPPNRLPDWVCVECVRSGVRSQLWRLGAVSSSTSSPKRCGVRLFDINALPPSDIEGEGIEEELQDSRRHNAGDDSFSDNPVGVSVTSPNLLYAGNGFGFRKVHGITQTIKFGCEDLLDSHDTQDFSRYFQDTDLGFPSGKLRSSGNTSVKLSISKATDNFFQSLKEFISEMHGELEEGWHVELRESFSSHGWDAVYCAPNGRTFQSISAVAKFLGLMSNHNSQETEAGDDGSAALQKRFNVPKGKMPSKLSVSNGSCESKEVLTGGFHGELLSDIGNTEPFAGFLDYNVKVPVTEDKREENCFTGCQSTDKGFPVQLEDFFVLSPGKVNLRSSYHDTNHIWPIGYRSCWHDMITGSLFLCEVLDGGDSGPVFRVSRRSCSRQPIPTGSTVLCLQNSAQSCNQNEQDRDLVSLEMGCDEDDNSIQMMLSDPCPSLESDVLFCTRSGINETNVFQMSSRLQSEDERSGRVFCDFELGENIGEFLLEGCSSSSVWKAVSQKLVDACYSVYKNRQSLKLFCKHFTDVAAERSKMKFDSLAKFCSSSCPVSFPSMIQNDDGLETLATILSKWVEQDRFGLDVDFVQEIIEKIPGADACTSYQELKKRSCSPTTVGNGFLVFKMDRVNGEEGASDGLFRDCKRARMPNVEDPFTSDGFPPSGKPLSANLPPELVGDFLQAWEILCRFRDVLGLNETLACEELEEELICPWFGGSDFLHRSLHGTDGRSEQTFIPDSEYAAANSTENPQTFIHMETNAMKEAAHARFASATYNRCNGVALAKAHSVLLDVLVGELQSKVAALVDPHFDVGDLKTRRGRKRDADGLVSAKKTRPNLLPINELTWPELARRYILAVLAMDGNLESAEIAARESGKVFRCLQGDGGVLCGSLTGVSGMEADALLLAEAVKRIFGHLNRENDVVTVEVIDPVAVDCENSMVDCSLPEWAQALVPVKKLPTNVGTRIRKCVYEALEKDPPEWAKIKLEHSISKEVYKGNASGPTKKAVISVLHDLGGEDQPQQKPDKRRKISNVVSVSDIAMKKCRIVLRQAVAADDSKVFCNLLGRKLLNSSDNDDEGLLGSPAMVSRPLDFRTIDLRLAVGAYGGSHEAFVEDVRELWSNVHCAFGDQSDYMELAEALSQKFESLYESEVVTVVQRLVEYAKSECCSGEVKKEIDDLLASIREIPKAPWDDGVCKVCGIDKDDDSVLLCDTCDAEYHTYCLNPPLARIPEGNWYCPSCVAGIQMVQDSSKDPRKKCHGDFTHVYLDELTKMATIMDEKEYWEFTVNERTFLLKFMCDELLTSSLIHQHIDRCSEMSAELQHKLRLISSDWKNLKLREEFLAVKAAKLDRRLPNAHDVKAEDGSASSLATNGKYMANDTDASDDPSQCTGDQEAIGNHVLAKAPSVTDGHHVLGISSFMASHDIDQVCKVNKPVSNLAQPERNGLDEQALHLPSETGNSLPDNTEGPELAELTVEDALTESQADDLELKAIKKDISLLQDSINNLESQLLKLFVRREFVGADSAGRLYWVVVKPGVHPWVIVDLKDCDTMLANGIPSQIRFSKTAVSCLADSSSHCAAWIAYQTEEEIRELIEWLKDDDMKARELKEAITQVLKLRSRAHQSSAYQDHTETSELVHSSTLVTTATTVLESKYGSFCEYDTAEILKKRRKKTKATHEERMYRCECLEPIWPSRPHCLCCHRTFSNDAELVVHNDGKCNPDDLLVSEKSKDNNIDPLTWKGNPFTVATQDDCTGEMNAAQASKKNSSEIVPNLIRFQDEGLRCPFNFEDICSKFVTRDSNKELVKEIGLIGSEGIPSFVPGMSPFLSDSLLLSINTLKNDGTFQIAEPGSAGKTIFPAGNLDIPTECHDYTSYDASRRCATSDAKGKDYSDGSILGFQESKERNSLNNCTSDSEAGCCCVVPQSSLRPLVGKHSQILRRLKMNLLEMDAALPEEALRPSRRHVERRWAWRAFIKSAETIYEMVHATIILEDMIKTEYLRKWWWYWSSLSAAAKTSTLSSLSLRIYSLDASIIYDVSTAMAQEKHIYTGKLNLAKHHISDASEKSKLGRRLGKRRKESEG